MSDVVVIGGGVVGLSIAYQLARDGLDVTLLERGEPGREASWAGAGVLPPASWYVDHPTLDAVARVSSKAQEEWSELLRADSGVDDEYWRCGAHYRATPDNADHVANTARRWWSGGVLISDDGHGGFHVPAEAQVRNPRRLRALVTACRRRGVNVVAGASVQGFLRGGDTIAAVETEAGRFAGERFCVAAGCWTPWLVEEAGAAAPGRPVRGEMLLLRLPRRRVPGLIVHEYPYYAVPRRDGRVLVGATVETVGFDRRTTAAARRELLAAAERLIPGAGAAKIERQWAGLRPGSADTLPAIGPLPGLRNAWVASGHHRSGLQLAPATARIISAMLRDTECDLPTKPFDPARFDRPDRPSASDRR